MWWNKAEANCMWLGLLIHTAYAAEVSMTSGSLRVSVNPNFTLTIEMGTHQNALTIPPAVQTNGKSWTVAGSNKLNCKVTGPVSGEDLFGSFEAVGFNCTAGATPVNYVAKGYSEASRAVDGDGLLVFEVAMPIGATGIQVQPFSPSERSPPQFAPFPSFDVLNSPPLVNGASMCYGSERPHMLVERGIAGLSAQCLTLSGGMTQLAWPDSASPTGMSGAVLTAANEFHLSLSRLTNTNRSLIWSHGLSGEISEVPPGFAGQTMLYFSRMGMNAAVDGWGTTLRSAYKTVKKDKEDLFLQTLSLWTDNGAALNGMAWKSNATSPPSPLQNSSYIQLNWSMVDETRMGLVMDSVRSTGISPRVTQIDCWWYPTSPDHVFFCGDDWVPPKQFFPNSMGGVRETLKTPLMLYLPAVCSGGGRWAGKYNWTNTSDLGWVLPVADEQERFFNELFDYGTQQSSVPGTTSDSADPWPGVWAPPMLKAGWSGTNMAGYETDFFSDLERDSPESRSVYGKGQMLLEAMNSAAIKHNITVQICGGTVPDFLKSLTLPAITNARATNDYDGETPNPTVDGYHNYVAPDNSWPFWGTRMGISKDNFWTEYKNLSSLGYVPSGDQAGHNAELHAVASVLTGIVGIGDWQHASNSTLLHRLARQDGVLLKPDRPLGPMDIMIAPFTNASRALPNSSDGGRAWMTHVTCAPESPNAPEITSAPTRELVSHVGYDATLYNRIPDSLKTHDHFLQWIVAGVNTTSTPFIIKSGDLYPLPKADHTLAYRSFYQQRCLDGEDPFGPQKSGGSSCLELGSDKGDLFDISSMPAPCPGPDLCRHILTFYQIFDLSQVPVSALDSSIRAVLLGDMGAYASISGYRFRIHPEKAHTVVVVGQPGEVVEVTYLVNGMNTKSGWITKVQDVTIGNDGRSEFNMEPK